VFPLFGWEIILAVHRAYAFVMKTPEEIMIEREDARRNKPEVAAHREEHLDVRHDR
jgi:hypothetical protein